VSVTRLRCRELGTEWTWSFLEDGALLEEAPRGTQRYTRHRVYERASTIYQQLVAQDGALNHFEARVRGGATEREPTYVTVEGREYLVKATGTVDVVERSGPPPALAAWATLGDDPEQNVYFRLEAVDDGTTALGLWTRALCLSSP
jgi:hypothetical protein